MKIILPKNYYNVFRSSFFFVLVATMLAVALPSCSNEESGGGKGKKADYTIMLYGTGGGNLDESLMLNLEQAAVVGSNDRVKMTTQIKWSARFQNDPDYSGTRRFIVGNGQWEREEVMDVSLPLYDPANIADFINWSKSVCPASKYILILWNHGNGWMPDTDRPLGSRAVGFDDNLAGGDDPNGPGISIYELAEGIDRSNTNFEMIYFDACLMNVLENLGELTGLCKYTLAAGHLTPGLGGEYSILMTLLAQREEFVSSMKKYCRAVMNHWTHDSGDDDDDDDENYRGHRGNEDDDEDRDPMDLTLTDLRKLPAVFSILKEFSDELVDSYEDYQEKYDNVERDVCYFFDPDCPFVDTNTYLEALATRSGNARLFALASRFILAADQAIVCQVKNQDAPHELTWGMTLVNKTQWGAFYEPLGSSYYNLEFDRQTRWSRWLKLHNMDLDAGSYQHEH